MFNIPDQQEWPLFTTVAEVRSKFAEGTKIQVAIGGWGNTEGFSTAARTSKSRKLFAENVKAMIDATGADGERNASLMRVSTNEIGIDMDWEYAGSESSRLSSWPN